MPHHSNQTSFRKGQPAWNKKYHGGFGPRFSKRQSYKANRAKILVAVRARDVLKTFGLSIEQYEGKRKQQGSLCGICGEMMLEPNGAPRGSRGSGAPGKYPVLDHDHKNKNLRDFVHHNCNLAIGLFDEDPIKLRRAAEYLEKHNAERTG